MNKNKHSILIIPGETYPTHQSFMTEVYSKESRLFRTVFLMRTDRKSNNQKITWNKAVVYLVPWYSGYKIINSITTYFRSDIRFAYLIPWIVFKHKITIIQVRDITFPLVVALIMKLLFKKTVIYQKSHPHEYANLEKAEKEQRNYKFPRLLTASVKYENKILHKLLSYCDAIMPITSFMASNLITDYGLSQYKMFPFGMGFNFKDIGELPKISADSNIFKFIYTGTVTETRQLDILIEAISLVIYKYNKKKVKFEFVGGGPDTDLTFFKELVQKLGLNSNCNFIGKIERRDAYLRIKQSDAGLAWVGNHVRFRDASTTKMIEYLALGLPILATTSVLKHKEVLQETNAGLLCTVEAEDAAKKMIQIMDNFEKLKQNALKAKSYMKRNYSYNSMQKNVKEMYEQVVR